MNSLRQSTVWRNSFAAGSKLQSTFVRSANKNEKKSRPIKFWITDRMPSAVVM